MGWVVSGRLSLLHLKSSGHGQLAPPALDLKRRLDAKLSPLQPGVAVDEPLCIIHMHRVRIQLRPSCRRPLSSRQSAISAGPERVGLEHQAPNRAALRADPSPAAHRSGYRPRWRSRARRSAAAASTCRSPDGPTNTTNSPLRHVETYALDHLGLAEALEPARYPRHRFPAEIISHAVWLYHVFGLSMRDVELILAERGVAAAPPSAPACPKHACVRPAGEPPAGPRGKFGTAAVIYPGAFSGPQDVQVAIAKSSTLCRQFAQSLPDHTIIGSA